MARNYDQYCPVAHALDAVGDRWALLVARELMQGPKRYTDLAEGLPGIGTNILAARLRHLETAGVVTKKTLPPPAASRVYELTDYGLELKPVIRELALWGARSLGPPTAADELFRQARELPERERLALMQEFSDCVWIQGINAGTQDHAFQAWLAQRKK